MKAKATKVLKGEPQQFRWTDNLVRDTLSGKVTAVSDLDIGPDFDAPLADSDYLRAITAIEVKCIDRESGKTVFRARVGDYPPAIVAEVLAFALPQLFGTRTSQTPRADKVRAFERIDERLASGEWKAERADSGPRLPDPDVEGVVAGINAGLKKGQASVTYAAIFAARGAQPEAFASLVAKYATEVETARARRDALKRGELGVDLTQFASDEGGTKK